VDPLIVLVFREEGAPPATLHSRFSEDKSLISSMGYLSSIELSYEYVDRLVGGMIVFGLVLGGKRRAVDRILGKDVYFQNCTGLRSLAYWFEVY
jgi:hypothetical protein